LYRCKFQVRELETELAGEQRRHGETQKSLRRHERRLAELTEQMDIDMKSRDREQDVIEKLHLKLKQYKRQLDEAVSLIVLRN
jgi:peptidoglycan hydrolase CwlO-like protein